MEQPEVTDQRLLTYEKMLYESYVSEDEVAIRGLGVAYEMTLHQCYPDKVKSPFGPA